MRGKKKRGNQETVLKLILLVTAILNLASALMERASDLQLDEPEG